MQQKQIPTPQPFTFKPPLSLSLSTIAMTISLFQVFICRSKSVKVPSPRAAIPTSFQTPSPIHRKSKFTMHLWKIKNSPYITRKIIVPQSTPQTYSQSKSKSKGSSTNYKSSSPQDHGEATSPHATSILRRKSMRSLSMRLSAGLSKIRTGKDERLQQWREKEAEAKAEAEAEGGETDKSENCIWRKSIILGERCKIPSHEDQDSICYDEKGNRVSSYMTPRTCRSLPISRTSSYIEREFDRHL